MIPDADPAQGDVHTSRNKEMLLREMIAEVERIRKIRAELRETYLRLLPRSLALSLDDQDVALDRIEHLARLLASLPADG